MNDPSKLYLLLLFPAFALIAAIEALWIQRVRRKAYDWKAGSASLGVAIGQNLSGLLTAGAFSGFYLWVWQHHLFEIPLRTGGAIFALFLGVEFCYYWHHRASHECRWFWASHSVHHSPNQFNLSASYRLGWTAGITGAPLFYLPLIYLGFPPPAVFGMLALNLAYQFWLHSELVPKLGWFEWAFNTPSHHRVHHGTNPQYLDRNYGGILIVFDRLFGTYAEEIEPCRYGLVKPLHSNNPFVIAFHEWRNIARDLRESNDWRNSLRVLFGRPGRSLNPGAIVAKTSDGYAQSINANARSSALPTEIYGGRHRFIRRLLLLTLAGISSAAAVSTQSLDTLIEKALSELDARFTAADLNHDGKVTRQEAQGRMPLLYARFDAIDADRDGGVSLDEIAAYMADLTAQAERSTEK